MTQLEGWQADILKAQVAAMDELISWLDSGKWLPDAANEMAEIGEAEMSAHEELNRRCRVSQIANTVYGTQGMSADRIDRLYREGTPEQAMAGAVKRRTAAANYLAAAKVIPAAG